jgi:hypothetical protein
MKKILSALFVLTFCSISYSQDTIADRYPYAKIYVIDPQSNQEVEVATDTAILFKDAFIDLVRGTERSKKMLLDEPPQEGNLIFTITQLRAETNVNGYEVSLDYSGKDPNHPSNVYTFDYDIDNNTLYFYDPATQQWPREQITAGNFFNLRRTALFANQFNQELANQGQAYPDGQTEANVPVDLNAPVDADVVANTAPPAMPDYEQPECPNDGFQWQPGYWAYAPYRNDYYWVPGAWVAPPAPGVYWTPPYWGYDGDYFVFHTGYWGDHVGFYGGINYGYGYWGRGYYGGRWRGDRFSYNTAVVRVNRRAVHNTYVNTTVINHTVINNHVSYNGRGGVEAKPTPKEIAVSQERHIKPTAQQNGHQLQARANPNQFIKTNPGGKPIMASATAMTYRPQNAGLNGSASGLNGVKKLATPAYPANGRQRPTNSAVKPQQRQPGNAVQPRGQPGNPVNVLGRRGYLRQPRQQPNNQVQPQKQPNNAVQPRQQMNNPVQPQRQPDNAVQPRQQMNNPVKPQRQPNNLVQPQRQPANPAQQPNNSVQPRQQPNNPVQPRRQPANPVQPQRQPNNPVKPQGQANRPANQQRPPNVQVKPQRQPNNPVRPNQIKQNPKAQQPARQ